MYRIYIVEDDEAISLLVKEALERWGFECRRAQNFGDIIGEFGEFAPHLILMDISLPYYNGYYWCAEIRKRSNTPIIFLSSRSEDTDIVMAVNMGSDDYITKPFSTEVLLAKINAMLRRTYSYNEEITSLEAKGAILDVGRCALLYKELTLELTKNELRILMTLMGKKNSAVSREEIMKALWEDESFIDDNTLTVNINRLRTKLTRAGLTDFITTKKGMGYMIND